LNQIRVGSDTLAHLLKKTENSYEDLPDKNDSIPFEVRQAVEIEIKYAGYISRQKKDIEQHKANENKMIPVDFDYNRIRGLSTEAQGKLAKIRPISLGQAGRISGVSPADVSLLAVWLKRAFPIEKADEIQCSGVGEEDDPVLM
jgi:tRNA uridine 5-carboxymethylaminomethyl modification enzyme